MSSMDCYEILLRGLIHKVLILPLGALVKVPSKEFPLKKNDENKDGKKLPRMAIELKHLNYIT